MKSHRLDGRWLGCLLLLGCAPQYEVLAEPEAGVGDAPALEPAPFARRSGPIVTPRTGDLPAALRESRVTWDALVAKSKASTYWLQFDSCTTPAGDGGFAIYQVEDDVLRLVEKSPRPLCGERFAPSPGALGTMPQLHDACAELLKQGARLYLDDDGVLRGCTDATFNEWGCLDSCGMGFYVTRRGFGSAMPTNPGGLRDNP